ncbi:MAG TPA: radical SAM protein [Anaeromyxobacter sp.]|nr:radical SAM protein [Anaeromyxobacter sp.]
MARLLFADERGRVYDHPALLAAARTGDSFLRARGRPVSLPPGAGLCVLPGRRPVGVDPRTGSLVVLHEVKVGRRLFVPQAVGATLPPGYTRTLLPAASRPALSTLGAPVLPQWAYTAAAFAEEGPAVYALRTDRRGHWDPGAHSTPDLPGRIEALIASGNPIYRQLARCALSWRCFTAQNTFYERDEGAIPSSASCNAACIGCLSEADPGLPPPSHERIARAPSAEEMAEVAVHHLENARGRVMVSFGQGCEGEPLTRFKEIARAIRLVRARTRRGSIHLNTNGSLPRALDELISAGLDSVRVSLNSASADLYEAYYRPSGYALSDVLRSIQLARGRGVYVALNLLTFPGVTDREGEVERLCRLVGSAGVDQVQTRPLAIDPDLYMSIARDRGAGGEPVGIPALIRALRRARPGLSTGNFSRARSERRRRGEGRRGS